MSRLYESVYPEPLLAQRFMLHRGVKELFMSIGPVGDYPLIYFDSMAQIEQLRDACNTFLAGEYEEAKQPW